MVACYIKKMTETCLPMIGHVCDTIIAASRNSIHHSKNSYQKKSWKLLPASLIHVRLSKALMGSISKRKSSGSVFQVASHYSHGARIRYVEEQPELPALLKLVAKRSMLVGDRRKKATRKKFTDKNYCWACGHCFFERQKKNRRLELN